MSLQLLVAEPSEREAKDWSLSEDDLTALGPDPDMGGAQYRGPGRQEPRARGVGPRQAWTPGLPRGRQAQPGIRSVTCTPVWEMFLCVMFCREARWTSKQLYGRCWKRSDFVAANVRQTQLLGGGQRKPQTTAGVTHEAGEMRHVTRDQSKEIHSVTPSLKLSNSLILPNIVVSSMEY